MKKLRFFLLLFSLLALSLGVFAQIQNGQFTGTVTDPSGAAIIGAKVTVTNEGTNLSITKTTDQSGLYKFNELPTGTYRISTEATGFRTVTNSDLVLNAGTIQRVDVKMQLGQTREVIEVTGAAAAVNTEDSKLSSTVTSQQIDNLPLNGRNVYDLMQMAPGAVNVKGTDFENGHGTVVNGLREDFNGFLINGVSNKGLSGGAINVPIQDSVEEFQQLQLNMSAQYGNSAGGTVNLVTKSGTNSWHGSAWEYIRNDALDSNWFFNSQSGVARQPLRFNQFGVTLGGPIVKDKLFFFLSLQGDRFRTTQVPSTLLQESAAWRDAVIAANSSLNSVSALLYKDFQPSNPGSPTHITDGSSIVTADTYFGFDPAKGEVANYAKALCLDNGSGGPPNGLRGLTTLQHQKLVNLFGVTPKDIADMTAAGCSNIPGLTIGPLDRTASIQETSVSTAKTQTDSLGNLFNGNEGSLRLDYNWNSNNRMFIDVNYLRETDGQGPCPTSSCARGFTNPTRNLFPHGSFSFIHTFSPTILNEFRAGYLQNNTGITVTIPGVPAVGFSDGTAFFGAYNGYPQAFKENIYTYSDLVSINHGDHNMKVGVDFRRNIENSEFNIARPSYYFYDQVFFAADAPYEQLAGVDPGICKPSCAPSSYNQNPHAQLADNFRHWRNLEFGAYFQDDWKVSKRLTLNLGLRYDLYQRHHELDNLATTFILGPGSNLLQQIQHANIPAGQPGCDATTGLTGNMNLAPLVGVCGPGGFAPSSSLGQGDHNNFGPRIGFAWDVFGDGKTALRGGFGLAYEGTLYNPLSNSRWNLPYYTFNEIQAGGTNVPANDIVFGPSVCDGTGQSNCHQDPTKPVTFSGPGTNPNQGPSGQPQAQGNITGWDPTNPNVANLTGIIFPKGVRDPYVYNFYFGIEREFLPKTVLDVKYVGTVGHKLFRAEDVNRQPGSELDPGLHTTDNFGQTWTGLGGRLNPNYLKLRAWSNVVNSNYSSLQASVRRRMSRGLLFNVDYTYSHSIDNGSTWHSGATSANGAAAGEGYTTSQVYPSLDRGNSIFDFRHRLVINYVYQLPGQNLKGALGVVAGGWSYNGIWSFQSGPHWETYNSTGPNLSGTNPDGSCSQADINGGLCVNSGGDFNLDGGRNDRPNASRPSVSGVSHDQWALGWNNAPTPVNISFSTPCLGCVGNLGRNTFVGPGTWFSDMTLSKTFKFTERVKLKFDANAFNIFNHTNFLLAHAGGFAHNKYYTANFGQADATLNPRQLQFGLRLSF
jgi:outer membrane receptor protein involved in Fe transport